MKRPQPDEFAEFYQKYIDTVPDDVMGELKQQADKFTAFVKAIPPYKANFAYAPDKWTVKELLGHVLDTERIMAYRALRIGRNDKSFLPGFEESSYVANAHFSDRGINALADEFELLRKANLFLFNSFNADELLRTGTASGWPVSVRALLFIIAGHLNHHNRILVDRYKL